MWPYFEEPPFSLLPIAIVIKMCDIDAEINIKINETEQKTQKQMHTNELN